MIQDMRVNPDIFTIFISLYIITIHKPKKFTHQVFGPSAQLSRQFVGVLRRFVQGQLGA